MSYNIIGTVTKPQGLKGEFRAKIDPIYFKTLPNLKTIIIANKTYNLVKIIDRGGFFVLKVKELENIEQVEPLRNKNIEIEAENSVFKTVNYVGCNVVVNNSVIGVVKDVKNYGASDVLTIVNNKKEIMCAVVPNLIENFLDNNLILNEKIFNEVSL